jgi:hypothetical protein
MGILQKDIKLLWGRSGNRCAICQTELTQDSRAVINSFTLGEQAHIIGEKKDAARGISNLPLNQRNSYHNLILLCPTHHTEIDKNEADWTIEKIHQRKSEHELWVTETLSETINHVRLAQETALSSVIDSAVSLCQLENWKDRSSFALAPDPSLDEKMTDDIFKFRQKVISTIWPKKYQELKKSTIIFSILLNTAIQTFMGNCDKHNNRYYTYKFYKANGHNENYHQDAKRYNEWLDKYYHELKEATKAANWFADAVRENINPMFFAEQGKFLIQEGPIVDLSNSTMYYSASLLEFTEDEKNSFPDSLN